MMTCFAMAIWTICTFSPPPPIDNFFDALEVVESWNPEDTIYDGYLGPYQIGYPYWKESETRGVYIQTLDKEYAQKVMLNNWRKNIPEALERRDYQTLARFHNGGPDGPYQLETLAYWEKVEGLLYGRKGVRPIINN